MSILISGFLSQHLFLFSSSFTFHISRAMLHFSFFFPFLSQVPFLHFVFLFFLFLSFRCQVILFLACPVSFFTFFPFLLLLVFAFLTFNFLSLISFFFSFFPQFLTSYHPTDFRFGSFLSQFSFPFPSISFHSSRVPSFPYLFSTVCFSLFSLYLITCVGQQIRGLFNTSQEVLSVSPLWDFSEIGGALGYREGVRLFGRRVTESVA